MDSINDSRLKISLEEVAALLGQRDIEIMVLQKQLIAAQKHIEELSPKTDSIKAVK